MGCNRRGESKLLRLWPIYLYKEESQPGRGGHLASSFAPFPAEVIG